MTTRQRQRIAEEAARLSLDGLLAAVERESQRAAAILLEAEDRILSRGLKREIDRRLDRRDSFVAEIRRRANASQVQPPAHRRGGAAL